MDTASKGRRHFHAPQRASFDSPIFGDESFTADDDTLFDLSPLRDRNLRDKILSMHSQKQSVGKENMNTPASNSRGLLSLASGGKPRSGSAGKRRRQSFNVSEMLSSVEAVVKNPLRMSLDGGETLYDIGDAPAQASAQKKNATKKQQMETPYRRAYAREKDEENAYGNSKQDSKPRVIDRLKDMHLSTPGGSKVDTFESLNGATPNTPSKKRGTNLESVTREDWIELKGGAGNRASVDLNNSSDDQQSTQEANKISPGQKASIDRLSTPRNVSGARETLTQRRIKQAAAERAASGMSPEKRSSQKSKQKARQIYMDTSVPTYTNSREDISPRPSRTPTRTRSSRAQPRSQPREKEETGKHSMVARSPALKPRQVTASPARSRTPGTAKREVDWLKVSNTPRTSQNVATPRARSPRSPRAAQILSTSKAMDSVLELINSSPLHESNISAMLSTPVNTDKSTARYNDEREEDESMSGIHSITQVQIKKEYSLQQPQLCAASPNTLWNTLENTLENTASIGEIEEVDDEIVIQKNPGRGREGITTSTRTRQSILTEFSDDEEEDATVALDKLLSKSTLQMLERRSSVEVQGGERDGKDGKDDKDGKNEETLLDQSGETLEDDSDEDEDGDRCANLSISSLTHDISTTSTIAIPTKQPLSLANTLKGGKGSSLDVTFADVEFNRRNRNSGNTATNISQLNVTAMTALDNSDEDDEETMALDTLLRRDSDTGAMCTLDEILKIASLNNRIQPIAMEEGREAGSMEGYFPDTSPVAMKTMAAKSPTRSPTKAPTTKTTPTSRNTTSRNNTPNSIGKATVTPTRRSTRIPQSIGADVTLVDPSFDTSIISPAKGRKSSASKAPPSAKRTPKKGNASKSKSK